MSKKGILLCGDSASVTDAVTHSPSIPC